MNHPTHKRSTAVFSNQSGRAGTIALVAAALLLAAGGGTYVALKGKGNDELAQIAPESPSEAPTATSTAGDPASDSTYADGTYSATGSYVSPGGVEHLGVTVTLADDVITDAAVETHPTRPETKMFQGMFAANFKQFVIGKNIDEVHLSKVSGSSLTSGGFNMALDEIKSEARS